MIGKYTYGHQNINKKQFDSNSELKIGSFCSIAKGLTVYLGGNHRTDWGYNLSFK